jgi:two-component system NtrC family sensor kinase
MKRILILDDERNVATAVARILRGKYQVDVFVDGQEALEAIRVNAYSCVLSDIDMPAMSGIEFYELACRIRPTLAQHFLFHTGSMAQVPQGTQKIAKGSRPTIIRDLVEKLTLG